MKETSPAFSDAENDRSMRMRAALEAALSPCQLTIRDESARHRRHAEARAAGHDQRGPVQNGQTHYAIEIVSAAFDSLRPLVRHRLVNRILASEFSTGLHALSLTLKGEKEP